MRGHARGASAPMSFAVSLSKICRTQLNSKLRSLGKKRLHAARNVRKSLSLDIFLSEQMKVKY